MSKNQPLDAVAKMLHKESFPKVLAAGEKNRTAETLREEAGRLGIPYTTLRRKYYLWKGGGRTAKSLKDNRRRKGKAREDLPLGEPAKDFVIYLARFRNYTHALAELKKDYAKAKKKLPRGFSYMNIIRHVDIIKKKAKPSNVTPSHCQECDALLDGIIAAFAAIETHQQICSVRPCCGKKLNQPIGSSDTTERPVC